MTVPHCWQEVNLEILLPPSAREFLFLRWLQGQIPAERAPIHSVCRTRSDTRVNGCTRKHVLALTELKWFFTVGPALSSCRSNLRLKLVSGEHIQCERVNYPYSNRAFLT